MHGTRLKKLGIQIATAVLLWAAVTTVACAAPSAALMEQYVTEDSVLLYLKRGENDQAAEITEARIGTQPGVNARITGGDLPIVTWLLVDNSLSINTADRAKAKQMLTDLVAGRAANESFNLCTFSGKLDILLEGSRDYAELKSRIDQIENADQETYLTDVLAEVLDHEKSREDNAFVRVVVISDGVDNNPGGLTRDELTQRLKEQPIPIYTLGCKNNKSDSDQRLKAMYALSRQTNAMSWTLSELEDTLAVSQAMGSSELPFCVEVSVPEALRDGSVKGVQITFGNGATAETQAVMPFGEITPQQPEKEQTPVEPQPAPPSVEEPPEEKSGIPIPAIALAAVLASVAVGGGIYFLIARRRKQERIETVKDPIPDLGMDITEVDTGDDMSGGGTAILIGNDRRLTLCLTDRADPARHFEVPFRDKVSIGRGPGNQVVLNYDKSVSGTHCEVFISGNIFKIRDLGSRNGTYVDGMQVGDVTEISSGSVLKLGRVELVVEIR